MCRAQRILIAATAVLSVATVALLVVVHPGPHHPLRIPVVLLGAAAVVLAPYASFPWLVRSMLAQQRAQFEEELRDVTGAFLAGWEAAKKPEPDEPLEQPVRLTAV
jgi:hypothetical protein